jgi:hypothetical protein
MHQIKERDALKSHSSPTKFAVLFGCAVHLFAWFTLLLPFSTRADSWLPPRQFDVSSENKQFVAYITPGTKASKPFLIVSSANDRRTNHLWKTKLSNQVSPIQAYLSDDGESAVTLDNWFGIGYGDDVVAIYGRKGQLAKFSLEQFAPPPAQPKSAALPAGLYGGYENKFSHSTASRHWRENSIQFFFREADHWLFCLWLDWEVRWVVWSRSDGKLVEVTPNQTERLNIEGRRRALEKRPYREMSSAELNFLGRMRLKEDRLLIESWLQDEKFSCDTMQSYSSPGDKPEFTFTAQSSKRLIADKILARWDYKNSHNEGYHDRDRYHYLGTLKSVVAFPTAPAKGEGNLRLYLIPETISLDRWSESVPVHYLIADLKDLYPFAFENERQKDAKLLARVNFIIYGVTPGTYRLKVIWDKVAPFVSQKDIICQPHAGDYESASSPVISIRASQTKSAWIECKKLVVE